MKFVIIDESGRLFDPNDRFLIFAAVVTDTLVNLDKIIPSVKKTLPRKIKIAEIKFSKTGDRTRLKILKEIHSRKLKLFILVIDKEGRKIKDTPENYSLLIATLLKKIMKRYSTTSHILIDKHFTWVTQREKFNKNIQKILARSLFIEHLDSQQNTIVSLPDFVAGAIRVSYTKNQKYFAEIINDLIEEQIVTTWRKIKQKMVKA
ncbi:DUF3800 domain-containing protein [Candidatus Microgenomates bacterium]|nr:DUF3800 domain-containing protein [Candidatus Microgenomates bacterium]